MPVKAVVLAQPPEAGGKTPLDRMRPVELLPVANRPILFHGLETMAAAGIRDVAIVVTPQTEGPIREAIGHGASWGLDVSYLAAKRSRGLAGLLLEAEDFLDGQPFILQQGSGLLAGRSRPAGGRPPGRRARRAPAGPPLPGRGPRRRRAGAIARCSRWRAASRPARAWPWPASSSSAASSWRVRMHV